eukprot:TRINITY_DN3977_c0_g2_i1.p1 TRINITY_DN3977_c0_g2~~TRINITY_DN3977_c0_g2_i1.p1  ORF type:complete len:2020 (-),score=323.99 TRINITY_DN3977_c0_g2_i1:241-6300(-)
MEKTPPDSENNYFSLSNEEPSPASSLASSAANVIIEASIPASADHQLSKPKFSFQSNPNVVHELPPGAKSWILTSGRASTGLGPRYTEVKTHTPIELIPEHVEVIHATKDSCSVIVNNGREVWVWGRYGWGRGGMPTKLEIPPLAEGVKIVQHAYIEDRDQALLLSDGQMLLKGNYYTPTGPITLNSFTPCPVPHPSFKRVIQGPNVIFGIDLQNKLWEWGMVSCGTGNIPRHIANQVATVRNIPTLTEGLENEEIVDFGVGANHFVAIGADGRVWTWGIADRRLGRDQPTYPRDWTLEQRMEANCKVPTLLPFPDGALMARVEVVESHTITLDRAGQIWCWGFGSKALFDPNGEDKTVPTRIPQPAGVVFRAVTGAPGYLMALTTDGQVYGMGNQQHGQLGLSHKENVVALTLIPLPEKIGWIAAANSCSFCVTVPTTRKFGILKAFIGDATDIFSMESSEAPASSSAPASQPAPSSNHYVSLPTAPPPLVPRAASGYSLQAAPSVTTSSSSSEPVGTSYGQLTSYFTLEGSNYGKPIPASAVPLASVNEETGEESIPTEYGTDLGAAAVYGTMADLGEAGAGENLYKQVTELEEISANHAATVAAGQQVGSLTYSYNSIAPTPGTDNPTGTAVVPKTDELPTQGRDWNAEFQTLLSLPSATPDDVIARERGILVFYEEFVASVKRIASVIVSEVALPPAAKSIKPLNVGGIAGGMKFIVNNIFMKFAIDMHGIYGGDEWSRKAASLELLGQDAYLMCQSKVPDLRTPVMALVDYKGFRILATCVLPLVKGSSLLYGSDDGGRTCHADDAYVNEMMAKCGELLNLKEHLVTDKRVKISAPCDIEVHRGKDGNIYVLDTARVFPPEYPFPLFGAIKLPSYEVDGQIIKLELDKGQLDLLVQGMYCSKTQEGLLYYTNKGTVNKTASALVGYEVLGEAYLLYGIEGRILYYQLRPEFVRSYSSALSSDACSMFGRLENGTNNQEIKDASIHLRQIALPQFAGLLDAAKIVVSSAEELVEAMHAHGINLRYLGNLRYFTSSETIKKLIFSEMICRCLKNLINRRMRTVVIRGTSEHVLRAQMLHVFNQLFGESMVSDFFWTQLLKILLLAKYKDCLAATELDRTYDLRDLISVSHIFQVVQHRTGVFFSPATIARYEEMVTELDDGSSGSAKNSNPFPFSDTDLQSIEPVSKNMKSICSKTSLQRVLKSLEQSLPPNPYAFMSSPAEYEEKVVIPWRMALERIRIVFGSISRESANYSLHLALLCMLYPNEESVREAISLLNEAKAVYTENFERLGLGTIGLFYHVLGRIQQVKGQYANAAKLYLISFGAYLRQAGSSIAAFWKLRITERGFQASVHPVVMLVLNQLVSICWDQYLHHEAFNEFSITFSDLCRVLPFPGDKAARIRVFNTNLPLAIRQIVSSRMQQNAALDHKLELFENLASFDGQLDISDPACSSWVEKVLAMNDTMETTHSVDALRHYQFALEFIPEGNYLFVVPHSGYYTHGQGPVKVEYLIGAKSLGFSAKVRITDGIEPGGYRAGKMVLPAGGIILPTAQAETELDLSAVLPCPDEGQVTYFEFRSDDENATFSLQSRSPKLPPPKHLVLNYGPFNRFDLLPLPAQLEERDAVQVRCLSDPYLAMVLTRDGQLLSTSTSDSVYAGRVGGGDVLAPLDGIVGRQFVKFHVGVHGAEFYGSNFPTFLFAGLTSAGEIYTYGSNSTGAVGVADKDRTKVPRLLIQLHGTPIANFAAGLSFICALTMDGQPFIWGEFWAIKNFLWRTTDDGVVNDRYDTKPMRFGASPISLKLPEGEKCSWVSAGATHVVLVTDHGDIYYAGQDWGLPADDPKHCDLASWTLLELRDPVSRETIRIQSAACGYAHTLLLTKDGRVFAFGANQYGQLGDSTVEPRQFSSDLQPVEFSRYGLAQPRIVHVAAYEFCSAALDSEGCVWLWGRTAIAPVRLELRVPQKIQAIEYISARVLDLSFEPPRMKRIPVESKRRPPKASAPSGGADAAAIVQSAEMQSL